MEEVNEAANKSLQRWSQEIVVVSRSQGAVVLQKILMICSCSQCKKSSRCRRQYGGWNGLGLSQNKS
jgi:hypothetical protein